MTLVYFEGKMGVSGFMEEERDQRRAPQIPVLAMRPRWWGRLEMEPSRQIWKSKGTNDSVEASGVRSRAERAV